MNWLNIGILIYATLGFISSLMFGLHIISKTEAQGGWIFESLRSIIGGLCLWTFMILIVSISPSSPMFQSFIKNYPLIGKYSKNMTEYYFAQGLLSLTFFTLFYKFIIPMKVKLKDSILGAFTFVSLFVVGKSFYWIYLHYFKEEMVQSFGNFYTITIAVTWIYYLMCSFFMGASMAYCPYLSSFKLPRRKLSFKEKMVGKVADAVSVDPKKKKAS